MRNFFILAILTMFVTNLPAQTFIYRNKAKNNKMATTTTIDTLEDGYRLHVIRHSEEKDIFETLETGLNFHTKSWKCVDPNLDSNFEAVRDGNLIHLEGIHKGKEIKKTFTIDKNHWHQVFPHDLSSFLNSGKKKHFFWAIGTSGPGDMKAGKFKAIIKEEQILNLDIGKQEAIRVQISLAGFKSIFWKGNYWLRKSDGRYLQFKGKTGGEGSGETITQLTEERIPVNKL